MRTVVEEVTDAFPPPREHEQRYQAIVEDLTELICRFSPNGRLTFVNPAYCAYFGRSREELVGTLFLDRVLDEDKSKVAQHLASLGPVKPVGRIQHRLVFARGKIRWQEWVNRAILDESGHVLEFQAVGRDVTDMKTAVKFLQRTEKKYRTIFNNSPLGIFRSTEDGKLLEANAAMAAMFGYERPSAMVRTVGDLGTALYESPKRRQALLDRVRRTRGLCVVEETLRRRDGSRFAARIHISGVRDEEGRILFLEGLVDDVTERTRLEDELRRSEQAARTLLDAAMDAAYLLDIDGVVLAANRPGAERFGLTRREIAGRSAHELISWDVFEARLEKVQEVFCEKRPVRYEDHRQNGVFDIQITPVFDAFGAVDKAAVFIRDITEQTRLARLREDVERFTRHDMKTPLIGIVGFANLLLDSENLSDKQKQYLDYIKTNGEQMMDFIQKSLDLFRMEQSAYVLKPAEFNFSRILGRVLRDLRHICDQKNLEVDYQAEGESATLDKAVRLYGEKGHLESLFANLIKNAFEAAPPNSRVTVRVDSQPKTQTVEIHNLGAIPREIRGRFFKRYATFGKHGGTGLGAYIALLIAKNHNGDIRFETDETKGTSLIVTLPRKP